MSLAFAQIKVYVRGTIVGLVAIAVVLVLFKNRNNTVAVWFFGLTDEAKPVNVVWLLLSTASCTLVVSRVVTFGWGILRDLREVRRLGKEEKAAQQVAARAAELEERERRLDEKLKQALEGDHDES